MTVFQLAGFVMLALRAGQSIFPATPVQLFQTDIPSRVLLGPFEKFRKVRSHFINRCKQYAITIAILYCTANIISGWVLSARNYFESDTVVFPGLPVAWKQNGRWFQGFVHSFSCIADLTVSEFGRRGVEFEGEPLYACTGSGVQQQGLDIQAPRIRCEGRDCGNQLKQWVGVSR